MRIYDKMTDIIIYTTKEKLEHKKGADGYKRYYWELPRTPKQLEEGGKIYFACNGFIKGYFIIDEFNPDDKEMIIWNCDSWKDIKPIPTKSFQGFKYADKVGELDGTK